MTDLEIGNALDALRDLLEEERKSLLVGDLDQVVKMVAQKEVLISQLNGLDLPHLTEIKCKILRNQSLLNSALAGIRSVATRLGSLRRLRSTLETYDKSGRKSVLNNVSVHCLEKHA
jgi:hypothetical protein